MGTGSLCARWCSEAVSMTRAMCLSGASPEHRSRALPICTRQLRCGCGDGDGPDSRRLVAHNCVQRSTDCTAQLLDAATGPESLELESLELDLCGWVGVYVRGCVGGWVAV